jgi:hypothetical protein
MVASAKPLQLDQGHQNTLPYAPDGQLLVADEVIQSSRADGKRCRLLTGNKKWFKLGKDSSLLLGVGDIHHVASFAGVDRLSMINGAWRPLLAIWHAIPWTPKHGLTSPYNSRNTGCF